jgi:hypothetical protein
MSASSGYLLIAMTRSPEPWERSAEAPFVTIRAGGPLDGTVTISAISGRRGRNRVAATWHEGEQTFSEALESASYRIARAIAHGAARRFAAGERPTLGRS